MAESLADKLKRLAAEKKAAKEAVAVAETAVTAAVANVANDQPVVAAVVEAEPEAVAVAVVEPVLETKAPIADLPQVVTSTLQPTPSNHPLAMQFAEMETALLTADPTFKTILRDVHRTLGKDPELVTQMTEEEISLVVRGLVVFANAEIVEPAKAKAVKAGQAALKKKAISADDL